MINTSEILYREHYNLKLGLFDSNRIFRLGNQNCDLRTIHPIYFEIDLDKDYDFYYHLAIRNIMMEFRGFGDY